MSEIKVNHGFEAIAFYLISVSILMVLILSVKLKTKQDPAASTHRQIALL
jgi:hypothetical protein